MDFEQNVYEPSDESSDRSSAESDVHVRSMDVKNDLLGLLINWNPKVVSLFIEQVNLRNERPHKDTGSVVPIWLVIGKNGEKIESDVLLMTGITKFLKKAGSKKSFGWSFIGPNTAVQFIKVISALSVIQNNSFMQEMMRALRCAAPTGGDYKYLASLAVISNRNLSGDPIGVLPLAEENVHLFN